MNSKSLRRLAADHGSLHTAGLPPNYLFPPSADNSDLTSLDVLLAGPVGTPYSEGCWRLSLQIPPTYPNAPPTAQFRTRLWHPNIDEATGAVCVETLKRDWRSTLKLRDVLVTISCLLIQPNPASALNEAAGKLASEDWDSFCRRARLMTGIHAAVPKDIAKEVKEAQMRGEEAPTPSGQVQAEQTVQTEQAVQPEETVQSEQTVQVEQTVQTEETVQADKEALKGKQRVKAMPVPSKVQQEACEDEENRRRRAETQDPDSDPEGDWIPDPDQTSKATGTRDANIFGIKGLEGEMQLDASPKRIFPAAAADSQDENKENYENSDPFITVSSKRTAHANAAHDVHMSLKPVSAEVVPAKDTPELLKFSHANPFSAIQPNNQTHPLFKEFSYSWEQADVLNGSLRPEAATKTEIRKRMADEDFDKKREWEMKRFKKAGYNLDRYNRGDFGPRTGIYRL